MASGTVTTTTIANQVPEWWSLKTQDAVEFGQVVAKRVCTDYEGEVSGYGDTVNIQTTSNYTANTKSAATDVTFEKHTHPQMQLVVNTHQYAAFKADDIAKKQAIPNWTEKQLAKLGYALARGVEVNLTGLFDAFSDNGTIGSAGVDFSDSDFIDAWTKLAEAGAVQEGMIDENVSWFLSPAAVGSALKIDKFTRIEYGDQNKDAVQKASLGVLYQGRVFMTNLLESDAAGQHDNALIHRDAIALAIQQKTRVKKDWIVESIAEAVVADQFYGYVELKRPQEAAASVTLTDNFGVYMAGK